MGYWAMLLRSRGIDINAYDKFAGDPSLPKAAVPGKMKKHSGNGLADKPKKGHGPKEPIDQPGKGGAEGSPNFWTKVSMVKLGVRY